MKHREVSEYLNLDQAAKELGISKSWIKKKVQGGEIPAKRLGRLFLLCRKEWEEWKARNVKTA